MNLFKHINIEKPTKWFLNLTSDKMSQESPSAKLRKNGPKYEKYDEVRKKTIKSDDQIEIEIDSIITRVINKSHAEDDYTYRGNN